MRERRSSNFVELDFAVLLERLAHHFRRKACLHFFHAGNFVVFILDEFIFLSKLMRHLLAQRRLSLSRLSALEFNSRLRFVTLALSLNARLRHSKIFLGGELLRLRFDLLPLGCDGLLQLRRFLGGPSRRLDLLQRQLLRVFLRLRFDLLLERGFLRSDLGFERCDFSIAFRGSIDKRLFMFGLCGALLRFPVGRKLLDFGLKLGNFRLFFSKRRFYIGIGLLALRLLHLLHFFLGRLRRLFALFKRCRKLRFKLRDTRLACGLGVLRLAFHLRHSKCHSLLVLLLQHAFALGDFLIELLRANLTHNVSEPTLVYLEHLAAMGALDFIHVARLSTNRFLALIIAQSYVICECLFEYLFELFSIESKMPYRARFNYSTQLSLHRLLGILANNAL